MLSKSKIKLITSLFHKKYRDQHQLFVVEGTKSVIEIMQYFECEMLCATTEWLGNSKQLNSVREIITVTDDELKKISFLKTPQKVLAVFKQKETALNMNEINHSLSLALDTIQDPGNMGTIIRIADWFGIKHIFCSPDTVDAFSPKTIQATMGAIGRVSVHYVDLQEFLQSAKQHLPVWGTFLDGENIYDKQLSTNGVIVMGNEGNGISPAIESLVTDKLLIPSFPPDADTSESLNVAVSTAIVCAEFRRKKNSKI